MDATLALLSAEARVPTASARRYLAQLCKHWGHKFPVEHTPEAGRISFGSDRACHLRALPDVLVMRVEAADEQALAHLQRVVADHLRRFAFRETDLPEVRWTRGAPEAGA